MQCQRAGRRKKDNEIANFSKLSLLRQLVSQTQTIRIRPFFNGGKVSNRILQKLLVRLKCSPLRLHLSTELLLFTGRSKELLFQRCKAFLEVLEFQL
jgi:hypothetical protein